jgi:two-component system, OmpR family, KDP operon response regulator KdpE
MEVYEIVKLTMATVGRDHNDHWSDRRARSRQRSRVTTSFTLCKVAATILIIDPERHSRRFVTAGLELYGYSVTEAEYGVAGLSTAMVLRPDLIIFDPALPDINGAAVLQSIRSWSNVPVIIVSTQSENEHKVHFLRSGADDYMTKPFGIPELAARCDAALRRYRVDKDPVVQTGPLTLDLVAHNVTLNGKHVELTRQEYRLLNALASHLGLVITHNQLIQDIWGNDSPCNIRYLRTLVRKLRQKIEMDPSKPRLLISESGIGYCLKRAPIPHPH